MSFIEKQEHNGHTYYYLVKNVRLSPERSKKIRKALGTKLPDSDELKSHLVELEKRAIRERFHTGWISEELAEKVDDLAATIRVYHDTPFDILPKDFLVRYTYNTNAIEGNRLTLRQTALVIIDGVTPEGASAVDVIEVLNAVDAWQYLRAYRGRLSRSYLCKLQYEITKHTSCRIQGKLRDGEVRISGSDHIPPKSDMVPMLLDDLFTEYYGLKGKLHPVELASYLHNRLVNIHPFTDGNGKTARLLLNWVLYRNSIPPVIIEAGNKERYYSAIEAADKNDHRPFAEYLCREVLDQYTIASG